MAVTDTIADFLTRIRNASKAKHKYVDVKWSMMNQRIAQIMIDQKYIEHFLVKREGSQGTLRLFLRYVNRNPLIRGIERKSTGGRRKYVRSDEIPYVFNNMGISIISTSQGVLVGSEARKRKVGGELICYIW